MVGLWICLALLGLLIVLLLLPVELSVRHHQEGLRGRVQYRWRIGPLVRTGTKEVSDLLQRRARQAVESVAGPEAAAEMKAAGIGTDPSGGPKTGAPTQASKKKRPPEMLDRTPAEWIGWALPAVRYFRRRVRFRRLNLFVEIGGLDAFESAMLAGLVWTVAGTLGSVLSHLFPIPPGLYRVTVQPNWQEPALGVNLDCMATFRVGHAIWAGVLLVSQARKSPRAAASRRRRGQKGEEARG